MKKRLLSLGALLLAAVSSFAQGWTLPEVPASDMVLGEKCFLYNKDAGGFLRGLGKDASPLWGTRAGVAVEGADTVIIQKALVENVKEGTSTSTEADIPWMTEWDNETYLIQVFSPKDRRNFNRWDEMWFGLMDYGTIWTDRQSNVNANTNFFWNIEKNANGYYEIKTSAKSTWIANDDLYASLTLKDVNGNDSIVPVIKGGERLGIDLANADLTAHFEGLADANLAFDWVVVSVADFEALDLNEFHRYNAALSLKALIDAKKVEYPEVDFSAAEAVYNNTASTIEELEAAKELVNEAIMAYVEQLATPENPMDMTADLIVNYDFESSTEGWTSTTGCQNNVLATNQCDGVHATGHFWENWDPNLYTGKMHKVVSGLPKGVYTLQLAAFSNHGKGVYLYANDERTEVTTNTMNTYKLAAYVDVDTLDLGIQQYEAYTNWMGIDNVKLVYYGNSEASHAFYKEQVMATIPSVDELITDETLYTVSYKEAFEAAYATLETATAAADVKAASVKTLDAYIALSNNIEAYNKYIEAVAVVAEELANNSGLQGDSVDYIADYLGDDTAPGEVYPNGGYVYITENPSLTTEQIYVEIENVNRWKEAAFKYGLTEGADCTNMLVNPSFKDGFTGWTYKYGGVGGVASVVPNVEVYQKEVDVYQELSDVPAGLYSISAQAFERPAGNGNYDGTEESKVFLYMNEIQTPVMNITKDAIPAEEAIYEQNAYHQASDWQTDYLWTSADGSVSGYVPNSMTGASYAFNGGRYVNTCYGVVGDDGKMKIGLTSNGVTVEWVLWANFKLTYEGKNPEAMAAILTNSYDKAVNYQEEYSSELTTPANDALNNAIIAAESAVDSDDYDQMYAALTDINKALAAADENRTAVAELTTALDALDIALIDNELTATEEALIAASSLLENYGNEAYMALTTEEVNAAIDEIAEATAALKIPNTVSEASDDNPIDMTALLVNADFSEGATVGWSHTKNGGNGPVYANAFDGAGFEFWNSSVTSLAFDIYQSVTVLPEGKYTLAADLSNSYNDQTPGTNGGREVLYAAVVEGTDTTMYSVEVEPQTEACTATWNNYQVTFDVPAGAEVIVGAKTNGVMDARWCVGDSFTLTYYGTESAKENSGDFTPIEGVDEKVDAATPVAIYNISGARVNNFAKGINIVKMSDGSVKKVLVK